MLRADFNLALKTCLHLQICPSLLNLDLQTYSVNYFFVLTQFCHLKLPYFWVHASVCVCVRARESISLPVFLCMRAFSLWVNLQNESSYYCWEPAGRLQWQPVISAPHTLKIPSRWHPFVPHTIAPFLQPSALLHLRRKMNLLPVRQSSVRLLQLNVAGKKISGRPGSCNVVLCCSLKHHYCAQAAAAWKQEHCGKCTWIHVSLYFLAMLLAVEIVAKKSAVHHFWFRVKYLDNHELSSDNTFYFLHFWH